MKKLLQKISIKKGAHGCSQSEVAQQTSSNNDSQHGLPNSTLAPDNELDRGKLADSMREVSQVLGGTHDVTGRHLERDNKAYRCKQVAANFLQRLSAFTNLVQNIANAHPYAKMAWAIISGVVNVNISFIASANPACTDIPPQMIVNTQNIDQNILDLFETLNTTYKFIEETKKIENHPSYTRILSALAKQTVDCAYFIRDYAKNAKFWVRVGRNVIGAPIKTRVQTYQTAFSRLLAEFQTHSSLYTELAVGRVLELDHEICEALYLDSLPYVAGAGLNTGKQCLLGTRIEVLDEIVEWINDGDESCPRLFWLAGTAGVGKSAIAHSIAVQFESIGRLGSFFCFDRSYSLDRRKDRVFSTIARDLADLDVRIKHELAKVIRNKTSLRTTTDLHLQWKTFISKPLNVISEFSTGPILIIVDALDECDNPSSRQDLLRVLEMEITSLPVNVRFLITSRPENDIILTFNKLQPHIRTKMMDTIPESESKRDILTYFKANLDFFGDAQLMHLVGLSQGLFQWAFLALQFLNGLGNSAGLTFTERFENLISPQHIRSISDPLDVMYTQILSSLFNTDDSLAMARFRSTIGSIVASSEPLSLMDLVALRSDRLQSSKRKEDIQAVIQYMGSLLSGIDDPFSPIRPLHLSFREYLLDSNRSHTFSVNLSPCHHDFAVGCIRTMTEGLRFNICDIPDSHKRNSDYEDLPARISSSISLPLSYSCRFWALHVYGTDFDSSLAKKVEKFLHHGFLSWLEVLSLVEAMNTAAKLMSRLISWSSGKFFHKGLYDFAVDGKRFVRLFNDAIAVSTPHIYLSALPFCPQDSIIYKTYIQQCPNTLRIASEAICDWSLDSIGPQYVGYLECVSFSHGGEYLAISLSHQGIIKVLDAETFGVLWVAEVPDNEPIRAIQFSLDDRTVVLATRTKIYLFDILMGGLTFHWDIGSTYGENNSIWKTRFSQNARYIASFCECNLIVWNLQTKEETINIPFNNKYQNMAGFDFSIGGDLFITFFVDIGAQVWDLKTGTVSHGPFQPPQTITIDRTIVSPNGKDLFLLNNSRQLHKWNFQDKSLMEFNTEYPISDILISPNGGCVVIDCFSRLILHDMNGNELHYDIDYRFPSTFSKDGKHLTISEQGGLKIWELDGWQSIPNIQQSKLSTDRPHFRNVSPDGRYFLTQNRTEQDYYKIWDIELEQSIQKPNNFASIISPIFSPLSRYLAYLPTIKPVATIYDIHSGTTKEFISNDEHAHIEGLEFSQDEMRIATLDLSRKRIDIWDITSCHIVETLTIPKVTTTKFERFRSFKASPTFQYFAYLFLDEGDIILVSRVGLISVNFLITRLVNCWDWEDFSFSLDEEYILISCDSTIFHINLITQEHRTVALCGNHNFGHGIRQIHVMSSSDAILVDIDEGLSWGTYSIRIWNAFSGQLLHSALPEYPDIHIDGFIPVKRCLFTQTRSFSRILTLDTKRSDLICFSSNEQHSLKNALVGSSARLCNDGWVITQNNELLFWVPNKYHQTLHTPKLKFIFNGKTTELDLSSFTHGKSWASCRVTTEETIIK